jgi:hypothetical protein
MANTYKKIIPAVPPPTVHNNFFVPGILSILNSSIRKFIPKTPAITISELNTRVAVVKRRRPLLPISEVAVAAAAVAAVGLFLSLLWTACTFEEANLLTVKVSAINMLWPIELI